MNELYLNRSEVRVALLKRDDAEGLKAIDALTILTAEDISASAPAARESPPFVFKRYVNGVEMAEGVLIERDVEFSIAMRLAAKHASRGAYGEIPVLILDRPSPSATSDDLTDVEKYELKLSAAIGTCRFMDPPDGGDVSLVEQVRRMRSALDDAESLTSAETNIVDFEASNRKVGLANPNLVAGLDFVQMEGPAGFDHLAGAIPSRTAATTVDVASAIYQCMATDDDPNSKEVWMDVTKLVFDDISKRPDFRSRILYAAPLPSTATSAEGVAWEYETEMGDHGWVKVYGPVKPDTRDYRCRNVRALAYANPPSVGNADAVREVKKWDDKLKMFTWQNEASHPDLIAELEETRFRTYWASHDHKLIERVIAALSAPVAGAWQDISTAPKNGKPINIYVPIHQPDRRVLSAYWTDAGWWICSGSMVMGKPTLWQPLPAEPFSRNERDTHG